MSDTERIEEKLDMLLRLQNIVAWELFVLSTGRSFEQDSIREIAEELKYYDTQTKRKTPE